MTPLPGTDQTASSANSPRSASPSFRANASKMRRTIASFSAADTTLLPAVDEPLDVKSLRLAERRLPDETAHLLRIVVQHGRFEMLPLGSRLAQLAAQPAQEAHRCRVGHAGRLDDRDVQLSS